MYKDLQSQWNNEKPEQIEIKQDRRWFKIPKILFNRPREFIVEPLVGSFQSYKYSFYKPRLEKLEEFLNIPSSLDEVRNYFGSSMDLQLKDRDEELQKLKIIMALERQSFKYDQLQLQDIERISIQKKIHLEDSQFGSKKDQKMFNHERQKNMNLIQNFQQIESYKQKFYEIISMNATVLSLQCKDENQKLTAVQIAQFAKIPLTSLKIINLKGNSIGDQGVQALCQAKYDNLTEIDLSDNGISIKGVSHLVNNTWDREVNYKLETVITKDGGYALKAGENIKTIKAILKDHTKIDLYMIDQLEQKEKRKLYRAMHFLMEIPLEGRPQQTKQQSDEVFKQLKEAVKSQPISIHQVLLTLKEILKRQVTFSRKTNVKSQMTIKILTSGVESQNIMIKHRINDYQWSFKDLKNNSDKIAQFVQWYKLNLLHDYGADLQDLTIHKITEGSINVWMSVSTNNPLVKNIDFTKNQQISIVPFFAAFNLSAEDFDGNYDYDFPETDQCQVEQRGGIPYLKPNIGTRFGTNVFNLYDEKDNDWISMIGLARQYAVGFHGVTSVDSYIPQKNMTVLQSIFSGRRSGQMLQVKFFEDGGRQAHRQEIAANKPGQKVGEGIYISPLFTTCLLDYTQQCKKLPNQPYRVVFQVRFKPEALKCTSEDDYWVINHSKDLRPYGIILFTPQQYQFLDKRGEKIFKELAINWNCWKNKYEEFRLGHGLPLQ